MAFMGKNSVDDGYAENEMSENQFNSKNLYRMRLPEEGKEQLEVVINAEHLSGWGTAGKPIEVHFAAGRYDFDPANARREAYQIFNTNGDPMGLKAVGLHLAGAKYLLITVHKDSAYTIKDGALVWQGEGWTESGGLGQELDPKSGRVKRLRDPLAGLRFEETKPFLLRATGKHRLKAGLIYQLRNPFRDCCGAFTRNSRDITWTPEVDIRGCKIMHIPTRGFLITTRRPVVVEDNHPPGSIEP
jgi:hypothetical protein